VKEASEQVRENADPAAAAAAPAVPIASAMGNAAFTQLVSRTMVAREFSAGREAQIPPWHGSDLDEEGDTAIELDTPSTPTTTPANPTATAAPAKYPTASDKNDTFDDGNAAVAHISSGAYVGEASVQFSPTAGDVTVTGKKGAYTASVPITWALESSASMTIWNPSWPDMSESDKAAVASMRAALLAHEQGHFDVGWKTVAPFTKISATGATQQAAVDALQAKAPTEQAGWQTKIETADKAYDAKTGHGKTQSAVGGTNVTLDLSGGGGGKTP
jgi:Bacterial protein of unknown function (DUF922)